MDAGTQLLVLSLVSALFFILFFSLNFCIAKVSLRISCQAAIIIPIAILTHVPPAKATECWVVRPGDPGPGELVGHSHIMWYYIREQFVVDPTKGLNQMAETMEQIAAGYPYPI